MNILERIIADKIKEVALRKKMIPTFQLERSFLFDRPTFSLVKNLQESTTGIIAEYKRRSPSKGIINNSFSIADVASSYENAGVCGISVLTDGKYFGGSIEDLATARASCKLPILRKDFIVDTYQIFEAKAHGADVILLIAAVLSPAKITHFSQLAKQLNLEVLLEVNNVVEIQESMQSSLDLIGINNRNLKTFEVNLNTSKLLSTEIPDDFIKISESGISNTETILELKLFGFRGFLIGENFMKTENPGHSAKTFINNLKKN